MVAVSAISDKQKHSPKLLVAVGRKGLQVRVKWLLEQSRVGVRYDARNVKYEVRVFVVQLV